MTLPVIDLPLFELTIPSNNRKVKYRPFTVKEEKILLIAKETKEMHQYITSIKQVISNCFQNVDVDKLSTFDFEYMLICLRARSVSNGIEFTIKDPDTEENVNLAIDLNDIEIIRDDKHSKLIPITDNIQINMKYPDFSVMEKLHNTKKEKMDSVMLEVMLESIDQIIYGEEVFTMSDYKDEEKERFVENLSSDNLEKIKKFFDTFPKIRIECPYKNSEGKKKTFVIEGIQSFFI